MLLKNTWRFSFFSFCLVYVLKNLGLVGRGPDDDADADDDNDNEEEEEEEEKEKEKEKEEEFNGS